MYLSMKRTGQSIDNVWCQRLQECYCFHTQCKCAVFVLEISFTL